MTTRTTSVRTLALAAILALGFAVVPAAASHAADGDVTWTVRTASNDLGGARTSYNYTINPGAKVDDALVITNSGSAPLDLAVYAADGYTTDSGQFDLVVAGEKSVSVGTWVHSASDQISVGPGETVEIPFSVTVPTNATPGDYAGGIVTSLVQPDSASGITVDRRLGIKIALRVGGDLAPSLAVENVHVDWSGGLNPFAAGNATMTYTIHNTGNAALDSQQAASVSGPFGLLRTDATEIAAPPRLLPGESWDVTVPVHGVAAAILLAATATVTPVVVDASGSSSPLAPVVATATGLAVPWTLLIAVLVLAAAVVLAVRVLRRRRSQQQAREDERVREAVELALSGKSAPPTSAS